MSTLATRYPVFIMNKVAQLAITFLVFVVLASSHTTKPIIIRDGRPAHPLSLPVATPPFYNHPFISKACPSLAWGLWTARVAFISRPSLNPHVYLVLDVNSASGHLKQYSTSNTTRLPKKRFA
jgi:hypothetical protein